MNSIRCCLRAARVLLPQAPPGILEVRTHLRTPAHWSQFQSVMRYYRASNIAISFAVGALAMNRVVALAHTLRTYHRTSGKGLSLHFIPLIGPGSSGMLLATSF